jgi:hypothetical protein
VSERHEEPTLRELGLTRDQSSQWQQWAAILEDEFERRLKAAARDPSTSEVSAPPRAMAAPR